LERLSRRLDGARQLAAESDQTWSGKRQLVFTVARKSRAEKCRPLRLGFRRSGPADGLLVKREDVVVTHGSLALVVLPGLWKKTGGRRFASKDDVKTAAGGWNKKLLESQKLITTF